MVVEKKNRIRTPKACNYCRQRKVKCNGKESCQNCIRHQVTCEYSVSTTHKYRKRSKKVKQGDIRKPSTRINIINTAISEKLLPVVAEPVITSPLESASEEFFDEHDDETVTNEHENMMENSIETRLSKLESNVSLLLEKFDTILEAMESKSSKMRLSSSSSSMSMDSNSSSNSVFSPHSPSLSSSLSSNEELNDDEIKIEDNLNNLNSYYNNNLTSNDYSLTNNDNDFWLSNNLSKSIAMARQQQYQQGWFDASRTENEEVVINDGIYYC